MRVQQIAVASGVVLAGCRPAPVTAPAVTAQPEAGAGELGGDAVTAGSPGSAASHASPGCGGGGGVGEAIEVDGVRRTFVVDLPEGYDSHRLYPVVYGFHGNWDSGEGAQKGYAVRRRWPQAIAIYPDGLRESDDGPTTWAFTFPSRDLAFFDALHGAVREGLCVDETRVFAIGYSAGGFMANALACAGRLAGVAAISGGVTASACEAPVPVWLVHGETDEIVPMARGLEARDLWLRTNSCQPDPVPASTPGCVRFEGCKAPVVWCSHPEGHVLRPDSPARALAFFRGAAP